MWNFDFFENSSKYIILIIVLKILAAYVIRPYKGNVKVGPTYWNLLVFILQYHPTTNPIASVVFYQRTLCS